MKNVLDACCGSRMFWFNKSDDRAVFNDIRKEDHILCDGRNLSINPDVISDFQNMPFSDEQFNHVVFDPPHLCKIGDDAYMALKYGKLPNNYKEMIKNGFKECFRVLAKNGTLVFKWNEDQIKVKDILALTDAKPLYGHISGKRSKTHWIVFIKE